MGRHNASRKVMLTGQRVHSPDQGRRLLETANKGIVIAERGNSRDGPLLGIASQPR